VLGGGDGANFDDVLLVEDAQRGEIVFDILKGGVDRVFVSGPGR
jgi:hypothetical protein